MISWNVQGLTKYKLCDEYFLQYLTNYDVILLGETWTNESSCYNINGFQNFAAHRKLQKTSACRSSGGVIAYIKNDILRGVSPLQGCTEEAVWLKFHKDFYKIPNDIIICLCYVAPMNSSSRVQTDMDSFDNIILDIARLKALHPNAVFMVCGDMNGRTGVSPDYVINDNSRYLLLPDDYIEDSEIPWANEDHVVNTQGRSVLEVCKICDLRIVNGRSGLDKDIGRYTCYTHNGRSTVDYVLCSSVYLESKETIGKKLFFRSRDKHKRNPSITNRVNMISARKEFKSLSQKRQAAFEHRETRKLLNARVNNVKRFWRMFSGKQKDRAT